jgi:hypothetical protein
MRRRGQRDGNEPRARLASHNRRNWGRRFARRKPRYNTTPTNGLVLELSWRKDGRCLLVNVISKTAKFVLNLPEMIMNALVVALSVAL